MKINVLVGLLALAITGCDHPPMPAQEVAAKNAAACGSYFGGSGSGAQCARND